MRIVTINWVDNVVRLSKIKTSRLPSLDQKGFYAILGAKQDEKRKWEVMTLLYIGQAFDQTLRERIPQEQKPYKCVTAFLRNNLNTKAEALVMHGLVGRSSSTLSQDLVDDIERCLVNANQPLCNEVRRGSNDGKPLMITNMGGFYPLKEQSTSS
jgi:hypothetical protein